MKSAMTCQCGRIAELPPDAVYFACACGRRYHLRTPARLRGFRRPRPRVLSRTLSSVNGS